MHNGFDADALIVGAGPAGASTAIQLNLAGWRVILVEKSPFPRQKVCGECLSAASLALFDQLGVGAVVRARAGPELQQVGWMSGTSTLKAGLPPCTEGPHPYGRALGRDQLDSILVNRAKELGVVLIQPGKVKSVRGKWGNFECDIQTRGDVQPGLPQQSLIRRVPVVIDAHGSWERGPQDGNGGVHAGRIHARRRIRRVPQLGSDLFGFKGSFVHANLPQGLLPVISFPGGYGGMVLAEDRRLTLAGCIRRDALAGWRKRLPALSAGEAFESYLRASCTGVREALEGAQRSEPWLSIGPLRPQVRLSEGDRLFSVGNAAGETHPLIGEGMSMALQSAFLLTGYLTEQPAREIDAIRAFEINRRYRRAWRNAFALRLRLAGLFAHIAMHPALSTPVTRLLERFPQFLTAAAHLAGKARKPVAQSLLTEGIS